jgi:hypothetical protein
MGVKAGIIIGLYKKNIRKWLDIKLDSKKYTNSYSLCVIAEKKKAPIFERTGAIGS